jgi:serine/threonine protein kinase
MLDRGTRLGPYEIVSPLGAGGMGEVYRAHDSRLGRDVAVKVLSSRFSDASADARARFEREARTVSQLSHPHICTLHDVGRDGRVDYLVMELLEGETLAARIARGPIPVPEILTFAEQIAGALVKAHAAGVVHRDLKPGNMMVTPSGMKLLDFGLARPTESTIDVSQSPTASASLTREGAVVGTFGYMAPEQLEGKAADARTDLFAFGCVLYEMTTGRRAFSGSSLVATMSSVLNTVPEPPSSVDARVPRALDRIIGRCLEKDPAKRYASASEIVDELTRLRRWVREVGLPELARIVDRVQVLDEGPDPWEAFALAREIEKLAPDEPLLAQLRDGFTREITIDSEPPGAEVFVSYYGNPDGPFVSFGRTPITRVRYPRGFTRVRLELAGRRTVNDVIWNFEVAAVSGSTDANATLWRYELPKADDVPEGMEAVAGGKSVLQLAGLDHLAPEPMVSFHMDRHPVTNREFKAFVDAGGYANEALWTEPFVENGRALSWEEAMGRFTDALGHPGPAAWELGEFPPAKTTSR